jgi:hypothetical protein
VNERRGLCRADVAAPAKRAHYTIRPPRRRRGVIEGHADWLKGRDAGGGWSGAARVVSRWPGTFRRESLPTAKDAGN